MNNTFAAIVPLFNKEDTIERALASIVSQSYGVDEIIVVDDGSTDSSAGVVKSFIAREPAFKVSLLTQENKGVSSARNAGARFAKSDYIAFLDSDDEWLPEHLACLAMLIDSYPHASLFSCRHVLVGTSKVLGKMAFKDGTKLCHPLEFGAVYARERRVLNSSSAAFERHAFLNGPCFPVGAARGEDIYLWLRFSLNHSVALHSHPTVKIHKAAAPASRQTLPPYFLVWFSTNWLFLESEERKSVRKFLCRSAFRACISACIKGNHEIAAEISRLISRIDKLTGFSLFLVRKAFPRFR